MKFKIIWLCALLTAMCATAVADRPAANWSVVRAAEHGAIYAKSVPDEAHGNKGRTRIFRVGSEHDTQISEYAWYAREIHIGGSMADPIIVRFAHSYRGRTPEAKHLAIGIYRHGEAIREYSTLEMTELGSGVRIRVSNHSVFARRLGFRELEANRYVFEVEGISGKVFMFDLETGAVAERAPDQP